MKSRRNIFIAGFLIVLITAIYFLLSKNKYPDHTKISIRNSDIFVVIADTDVKRTQGLSGWTKLGEDEGMLFIFPVPNIYPFWMKEMKIPLDFIWIDENKVVDVTQNVPPPKAEDKVSALPLYYPRSSINKVLEVNAGFIKKRKIQIGDTVR